MNKASQHFCLWLSEKHKNYISSYNSKESVHLSCSYSMIVSPSIACIGIHKDKFDEKPEGYLCWVRVV